MKFSKINNFDLIRLFAAIQVVIGHSVHHLGVELVLYDYFLRYFPGVPIFFFVSGYLISSAYKRSPDIRSYAFNRIVRIYPALLVCLLVTLAFVLFNQQIDFSLLALSKWLVAQATVGQFYNPDFLRGYGVGVINGSLWTIPVELQFYILAPLIYLFVERFKANRKWFILLVLISFVVVNQVYGLYFTTVEHRGVINKLFGVTFLPFVYYFILGVIVQTYSEQVISWVKGRFVTFLLLHLVLANVMEVSGFITYGSYLTPILVVTLSLLVISAAYSMPSLSEKMLNRNDISYGVYIYHMLWVNFVIDLDLSSIYKFSLVIVLTLLSGILSWRLIERPSLSFKRKAFAENKV
ncbi:acyltransferase family protein [Vibrio jasicida]|uniref:acyltransferase family protein n=1 Tax=Vibrio jasicida TaxID=766224 RepID=UPI00039FAE30|nr:acyltransferase [Vibrio jasicida]